MNLLFKILAFQILKALRNKQQSRRISIIMLVGRHAKDKISMLLFSIIIRLFNAIQITLRPILTEVSPMIELVTSTKPSVIIAEPYKLILSMLIVTIIEE